jgi:hypothetical protein
MHPSSRDSWISKHDDYVIIGPRNADLTATPANGCSRNSVVQWWCCVCVSFAFSASMFLRGYGKNKQNLPLNCQTILPIRTSAHLNLNFYSPFPIRILWKGFLFSRLLFLSLFLHSPFLDHATRRTSSSRIQGASGCVFVCVRVWPNRWKLLMLLDDPCMNHSSTTQSIQPSSQTCSFVVAWTDD